MYKRRKKYLLSTSSESGTVKSTEEPVMEKADKVQDLWSKYSKKRQTIKIPENTI